MEAIIKWILGIGEWLFQFTKTTAGKIVTEYGDDIEKIIMEAATTGGTGEEKMAYAIAKLTAIAPQIAIFTARAAIEVIYSTWKEKQEKIDTDGDGVPDYRDLCKLVGDQGCGVDENGCPIPCEPDCPDGNCP